MHVRERDALHGVLALMLLQSQALVQVQALVQALVRVQVRVQVRVVVSVSVSVSVLEYLASTCRRSNGEQAQKKQDCDPRMMWLWVRPGACQCPGFCSGLWLWCVSFHHVLPVTHTAADVVYNNDSALFSLLDSLEVGGCWLSALAWRRFDV